MDAEMQGAKAKVTQTSDNTALVEAPFVHDDGWHKVIVEWSEDEYGNGKGAWVARTSREMGCIGIGDSQLMAMADLIHSVAAVAACFVSMEVEHHKTIHATPDVLAREIARAEDDLHAVQNIMCNELPDTPREQMHTGKDGPVDRALHPLWNAESALRRFAARIAATVQPVEAGKGSVDETA